METREQAMRGKQITSLILIFTFLISPLQGWTQYSPGMAAPGISGKIQDEAQKIAEEQRQRLQEQAKTYLQKTIPQQIPLGKLAPQLQRLQPEAPAPQGAPPSLRQVEETSAVEKRAAEHGLPVKQFGYSFFYKPPETFLPVQAVPVGPDYIIGPGDTIKIVVWGSVQGEYSLTADRNGQVAIPKVGVVHVSGLNFRQLREVMDKEFARQYTNFQMNVTLDNLRTITVFVVGQARFPGSYAISSLSTLINALFASGGPSKTGSMRDIQVRRGGRLIVHFDLYDFLLRGDKSKDIRLMPEDVIFIPPIGPLAAIGSPQAEALEVSVEKGKIEKPKIKAQPAVGGAVVGGPIKVPGIYELKNEKTFTDLLYLAGGLADTAFKGRVQVLRIKNHREMVLFEDDLEKVLTGRFPDIKLVDGDFVKIFPVPSLVEKKVRVAGAVKTPGEFGLKDNMHVKDLVAYAGGLLLQSNQDEAEITRVTITPSGPETTRLYIQLRRALEGNPRDNILLRPNDYLFVRTIPEWDIYKMVKAEGEIKYPGDYAIKKGETLSSLLTRVGGFTDKAYLKGAFFTREAVKEMQQKQLKQAIDRIEAEMLALSAQKALTALEAEDVRRQEVFVAQQQQLLAKMREIVPLGRVVIRLDDPERLRGTPEDFELQSGDELIVPPIQQTVNVLGAVVNPTAILYDPHLTVKDYVERVGGITTVADMKSVYVLKVNGAAISGRSVKWFGSVWDGSGYAFHVGGLKSMRLDPGDTIVVPEQLERIAWLREIKDLATIFGQFALMGGVVFAALK
jgi:polysaccharide export outer membrane protein